MRQTASRFFISAYSRDRYYRSRRRIPMRLPIYLQTLLRVLTIISDKVDLREVFLSLTTREITRETLFTRFYVSVLYIIVLMMPIIVGRTY